MKNLKVNKLLAVGFIISLLAIGAFAQRKSVSKPVIFAVINDGKTIEPIAYIDKKKLVNTVAGDSSQKDLAAFSRKYYKAKTKYKLIFAGTNSGVVTVKSSDYKAECSSNMAQVTLEATKTNLKGFVMGLATDARTIKTATGIRRLPTPTERSEFEKIVRDEFIKQKVSAGLVKKLEYHNLTAIDVDKTGIVELVGSFWVNTSPTERALLFLIVDKEKSGNYSLTFSDFKTVKQSEVMNEEIATIDQGIYHELLLDSFDYDGDGVSEIFTIIQGFEGTSFNVYKREKSLWTKSFEASNYHCGF